MNRSGVLIIGTMLVGLPLTLPAAVTRLSLKQLTAQSTDVVKGTVVDMRGELAADGIRTRVTIQVEESYLGATAGTIEVSVLGGEVGDLGFYVSEMPRFEVGQQVIVFARRGEREPSVVVGARQGKCTIEKGLIRESGARADDFVERIRLAAEREVRK